MAIGAVSADCIAAKNFQRLRSRIRMPGDQFGEEEMAVQAPTVEQPVE